MRAYARDLDLSVSYLQEVLSSKKNISLSKAQLVSEKLPLNESEKEDFISSVESMESDNYLILNEEQSEQVLDIDYLIFLELFNLKNFSPERNWLLSKLGVSNEKLTSIIDFWSRQGIIRVEHDHMARTEELVRLSSSFSARDFYRSLFSRSTNALHEVDASMRVMESSILAINPERIDKVRELCSKFRTELAKVAESGEQTELYYYVSSFSPV
jgi:hypothetical protein